MSALTPRPPLPSRGEGERGELAYPPSPAKWERG